MKHSIEDWTRDCTRLATQISRYAYANSHLPDETLRDEWSKTVAAVQAFANKYSMDYNTAESLAGIIGDSVDLGLAY